MKILESQIHSNLLKEFVSTLHYIEALHHSSTVMHENNVSKYMYYFSQLIGISKEKSIELSLAARFHDLGKIQISPSILNKTGPLDSLERKKIENHTVVGYNILNIIKHPLIQLSATLALSHHENFDGTGYPERLKHAKIPFECRICSICDVYDALRKRRSYKKNFSHQDAIELMIAKNKSGMAYKFDPELLKEFEKRQDVFEKISNELQQENQGMVT